MKPKPRLIDSLLFLIVLGVGASCLAAQTVPTLVVRGGYLFDAESGGALFDVRAVFKAGVRVDREALHKANVELSAPVVSRRIHEGIGLEIDGFEDGDLTTNWGGSWRSFTDSVAGGKSSGTVEVLGTTGTKHLRLGGEVSKGFQWGPWSGAIVDWSDSRKRPVDGSAYRGIRLRLRGSKRPYTITVNRIAVKDFNVFSTSLNVTEEWKEIEIPFDSLRQIGFGKTVPWAAKDLTGLNIDARNNPMTRQESFGSFHLEIDWIRLYPETTSAIR